MNHVRITLLATVLSALCSCISLTAFAGNTNDIINRERQRSERIIKEVTRENSFFKQHRYLKQYEEIAKQGTQKYQVAVQNIKEQQTKKIKNAQSKGFIKPAPQAVVFVSFSMPILSLKQIIRDTAHYQIPVVVRGLYENSFRKTIEKVFDLVKEDNRGGISINPVWFKKYDIKTVPAVVVNQGSGRFEKKDVIYGNIPLKRALTIVAERGDASKVAEGILNRDKT